MTNKERQGLQIIKESGLSYEIKFMIFRNEDSYVANVPKLVGTYELKNINPFVRDYQNFIRFQNNQLKLF